MILYVTLDQYESLGIYLISIGFKKLGNDLIKRYQTHYQNIENILKNDFGHLWNSFGNYFSIKTLLLPKKYQWKNNGLNYINLIKEMTILMEKYCLYYSNIKKEDCHDMWQSQKNINNSTISWFKDIWNSYALKQLDYEIEKSQQSRCRSHSAGFIMKLKDKDFVFQKLQKELQIAFYGKNREKPSKCFLLFLPPCCHQPAMAYVFQFTQSYTVTILEISRNLNFKE